VSRRLVQYLVIAGFVAALVLGPLTATLASGYHWARKQPQFTLQVGDNVDGVWDGMLQRAVGDWNKGDTVSFRIVSGGTGPQECRPVTGRVEVCNWRYGTQEGWLGLARLYFDASGKHIEAVTVQMNDSFFDTNSQYNNDAARRHTMCHELGHAPGLDHTSSNSCMNDSQYAVFNQLVPTNKDFKQLERIYKHTDSNSTVAGKQKKAKKHKSKNKKGKDGKKDRKRRQDGQRMRDQHAGVESIHTEGTASETVTIETLPDGRTVVSFVTWAQNPAS
jgi:predicted Zn-dependent protease